MVPIALILVRGCYWLEVVKLALRARTTFLARFAETSISRVCFTSGNGQADICNQYESCDECIANGIGCVWCPDPPVSLE